MRKCKRGFAIINLFLDQVLNMGNSRGCNSISDCQQHRAKSQDIRTLIMGIYYNSNQIHEFDIEGNGCDLLHQHDYNLQDFASSVYLGNRLIISGGSNYSSNTARKNVLMFTYTKQEGESKLKQVAKSLPLLNQRRMKHCQIIFRSVLFVFFGHQDTMSRYSETLEYLDLTDDEAVFREIRIENYLKPFVVEPMIFPAELCDTDS